MIPKAGGKRRRLGIPTVRDRVVQAALKLVFEPIFEADFAPCSYGFRPGRRAQDAIAEIHFLASRSYEWVVDADISACFDEIDHWALMGRVGRRIGDRRVLALVAAFLRAGILGEDGIERDTATGTPQGGILSPLLASWAPSRQRSLGLAPTDPTAPQMLASCWSPGIVLGPGARQTRGDGGEHPSEIDAIRVGARRP
jgi:RNA-directed DNA polymerase